MDLKQLKYFLCLAREGNVTRAAASSGLARRYFQILKSKRGL